MRILKTFLLLLLLVSTIAQAQHVIKGTFSPAENFEWLLLYKVTPEYSAYIDRTNIDREGHFEFSLDSTFTKGIYRIVYAVPQEEFNFDVIYNGQEDVVLSFNEDTGIEYIESVENKLLTSYTNSMAMISQSIGNYFRNQSQDSTALLSIFKTQLQTQEEFEKISKQTIAAHFIKANRPYVPTKFQDISTYILNLKTHYFDHVDFGSEILQSSSFLIERVLNYVFGMVPQDNEIEGFKGNVDDVVDAMEKASTFTKKMLLHVVWQQMVDANYEEVANYITDTYLLTLAKEMKDEELISELTIFKNLSFGKVAPDFEIELVKDNKPVQTTLHQLDTAECYVLVFWSSSCSHCLEELPQLHNTIKDSDKQQLNVIAIGLENDEFGWKNETYNLPEFTHVLGLGKWDNEIGNAYNVTSTPTYFVLDKDKKIIAKPIDFEALEKVLCD